METVIFILLPQLWHLLETQARKENFFLVSHNSVQLGRLGLTKQWGQEQQAVLGRWRGGEGQREGLSEGRRIFPALPTA